MKDNKKKTIVLTVLGVALVAVGAFQFLPKGGGANASNAAAKTTPANSTPSGTNSGNTEPGTGTAQGSNGEASPNGELAKNDVDPQTAMVQDMVKTPYAARDPFAPQRKPDTMVDTNPAVTTTTPPPVRTPVATNSYRRPPSLKGSAPWEPNLNGTQLEGPVGTGNPNSPIGLNRSTPLRQPNEFAYSLKGVLVGKKPMAVFEDDNGNQRLVPLGGSLDGDSRVVGIEKGKVRIRHRGKDQTHTLPEGP